MAPLRTHASLAGLHDDERRDFATVLKDVLVRFDNLWDIPFPYVMALHQAPTDGGGPCRLPLPRRVPPALAQAQPAEVSRGARGGRGELPGRYGARGQGRRASRRRGQPRAGDGSPVKRSEPGDPTSLVEPILRLQAGIRDAVVRACEAGRRRGALARRRRRRGRHPLRGRSRGRGEARRGPRGRACLWRAHRSRRRGPGRRAACPARGRVRRGRALARHRRPRRRHARPHVPEAQRLGAHGGGSQPGSADTGFATSCSPRKPRFPSSSST